MLGPVLAVTVGVPELGGATRAYRHLLGLEVLSEGEVPPSLAVAWDAPMVVGARWALLGRTGARRGLVRVLEVGAVERPLPFRTLGWAALEVLVADADLALERCRAEPAFQVVHAPTPVGAAGSLRALQVAGPGGEGVYLTEVREVPPGFSLPALTEGEGLVYAVVAATADLHSTRSWFTDVFLLRPITDHALPVRVLNVAFGLPMTTLHRLSSVQLEGDTLLEIDQYPAGTPVRRAPGGGMPGGLALVSFAGRRPPLPGARPLPPLVVPPYCGHPGWAVRGPDGLGFEVICSSLEERP